MEWFYACFMQVWFMSEIKCTSKSTPCFLTLLCWKPEISHVNSSLHAHYITVIIHLPHPLQVIVKAEKQKTEIKKELICLFIQIVAVVAVKYLQAPAYIQI